MARQTVAELSTEKELAYLEASAPLAWPALRAVAAGVLRRRPHGPARGGSDRPGAGCGLKSLGREWRALIPLDGSGDGQPTLTVAPEQARSWHIDPERQPTSA